MNTLKITEAEARKYYAGATGALKQDLEKTFGKEFFTQSIMDRMTSWALAAAEAGLNPEKDLPYNNPINNRQKAANAFFKLDVIAEILREGVILDWENSNQKKWYAWFNEYTPGSGFRFVDANYVWAGTYANGGARLCVDTQEKAKFMGTQFEDIYQDFLNPIN